MTGADFLVMTIIEKEMEALNQLGFEDKIDDNGYAYSFKKVFNTQMKRDVFIVHYNIGRPGNPPAASLVSTLLSQWIPRCVIVLGIAAGFMTNEAKIGDVLVADNVTYYSMTKEMDESTEIRHQGYPVDTTLLSQIRQMKTHLQQTIQDGIQIVSDVLRNPCILLGPILSGESVMRSKEKSEKLLKLQPKAVGLEMESYGVYLSCHDHPSRPLVLTFRGVSDLGDADKSDDYHDVAAQRASLAFHEFASRCDIDSLHGLTLNQSLVPALERTRMVYHPTEGPVYSVQQTGDSEITLEGTTSESDPPFSFKEFKLFKFKEIHLSVGQQIQFGASVQIEGLMKRIGPYNYVGVTVDYILLNPVYRIIGTHRVFQYVMMNELQPLEESISWSKPSNSHRVFPAIIEPAHVYLIGFLVTVSIACGGSFEGKIKADTLETSIH